jgi:micrococcal nuclease
MARHSAVAALLAAATLAAAAPTYAADLSGPATVTDGDTITVAGEDVRLRGIDAPETDQPHGDAAERALRQRIGGERVRVEAHGHGPYGRVIGTVYHEGERVGLWLVTHGHAWVWERHARDDRLVPAQRRARAHERGLWANDDPVPPWEWR